MTDIRGTRPRQVKCVVWDLDETLWSGILSEDPDVRLRPGITEIVRELDARGVLQSVASKNDPGAVAAKLDELGLADYFLFPQASWNAKSSLLKRIAEKLDIGQDTLLLVDDSPFERAEVTAETAVRVLDAAEVDTLLQRDDLPARAASEDGARRRALYRDQERRRAYEEGFVGPRAEFLQSLDMRMSIRPATPDDLARASELTVRTNQLNTTGITFSRAQLEQLLSEPEHTLLVVSLRDVFGDYGVIGLVLLAEDDEDWRIRLFLMSCRVMGRNVGGAVLSYLAREADRRGLRLGAEFRHTEVNRPMYLVYRLAGFEEIRKEGRDVGLVQSPDAPRAHPPFLTLVVSQPMSAA